MTLTKLTPVLALMALTALAACGVDGEPVAPKAKAGVSVSGDARVGLSYSK